MTRNWQIFGITSLLSLAGVILLMSGIPTDLPSPTAGTQLLAICVVYIAAGALFVPRRVPLSISAAILQLFCLYFIVKATGVLAIALAFLVFAFHVEVYFSLPLWYSAVLSLATLRITLMADGSYTAWDAPVGTNGVGWPFAVVFAAAAGGFAGKLVSRLAEQEKRQRAGIERLEDAVRNLTETNAAYQTYATYIEENSKEDERNRLTREIHDIVGYSMTNLLMIVQAALYSDNQDQVTELLQKAQTHINESMNEVRAALRRLRSTQKKALHGVNLVSHLTENFSRVTGIGIKLDVIAFPRSISPEIEKILYRMLQESMTNSFRHGRATEIDITFQVHRNVLFVKIRDNGKPKQSAPQPPVEGIGLKGMRERIDEIGGTLTTVSGQDGFTVFARIPYHGSDS